jgi:predicted NBD/HSP70 family sugar kinase
LGCFETLIAGPGLTRLTAALVSVQAPAPELMRLRSSDPEMQGVWDIWRKINAELLHSLILMVYPDVIILGGGLSKIDGIAADLQTAQSNIQLSVLKNAEILYAQGGDTSGARGAAFVAWRNV